MTPKRKLKLIRIISFIAISILSNPSFAQVLAGPMLGYSEMREVLLWVQTEKAATVKFNYWEKGNTTAVFSTDEYVTSKSNYFIAKLVAEDVLPGKKYDYELILDGKKMDFDYPLEFQTQTLWQYRSDPPAFKFAFGSCHYTNQPEFDRPGKPYGYTMDIFNKIYDQDPDFMMWGGDNIYLREVDWNTRSGIYKRYIDFKRKPELQKLFARTHNYAIWDDHDYGPNDADRSFWGKNWTLEAFKDNWGNPNYVFNNEATTGTYFWEDCQFFLLDDRWFRAPNEMEDSTKAYFGDKQIEWLIDALIGSSAPFKFIVAGGQVINSNGLFENMSTFPVERKKLLDKIQDNNISGVIFLTGDRHHTSMRKLERPGSYPLYDVTISALTSGAAKPTPAELLTSDLVPGTIISDLQSFSIMEVSGKRTDRSLKINVFDNTGTPRWDYTIKANDLKAKQ